MAQIAFFFFDQMKMDSEQKWERYGSAKNTAQKPQIPAMFSSLSKARESLVSRWHVAAYSPSDTWDHVSEEVPAAVPSAGVWQKQSTSILARWSSAYDVYLDIRGDNLTDKKRKGTAGLRILKELGVTAWMLSQTTVDDQINWDVFCPMFQKIVSLADDIVELDLKSTARERTSCIDMAIIGPLFEVS